MCLFVQARHHHNLTWLPFRVFVIPWENIGEIYLPSSSAGTTTMQWRQFRWRPLEKIHTYSSAWIQIKSGEKYTIYQNCTCMPKTTITRVARGCCFCVRHIRVGHALLHVGFFCAAPMLSSLLCPSFFLSFSQTLIFWSSRFLSLCFWMSWIKVVTDEQVDWQQ